MLILPGQIHPPGLLRFITVYRVSILVYRNQKVPPASQPASKAWALCSSAWKHLIWIRPGLDPARPLRKWSFQTSCFAWGQTEYCFFGSAGHSRGWTKGSMHPSKPFKHKRKTTYSKTISLKKTTFWKTQLSPTIALNLIKTNINENGSAGPLPALCRPCAGPLHAGPLHASPLHALCQPSAGPLPALCRPLALALLPARPALCQPSPCFAGPLLRGLIQMQQILICFWAPLISKA